MTRRCENGKRFPFDNERLNARSKKVEGCCRTRRTSSDDNAWSLLHALSLPGRLSGYVVCGVLSPRRDFARPSNKTAKAIHQRAPESNFLLSSNKNAVTLAREQCCRCLIRRRASNHGLLWMFVKSALISLESFGLPRRILVKLSPGSSSRRLL